MADASALPAADERLADIADYFAARSDTSGKAPAPIARSIPPRSISPAPNWTSG
jgi:hypothetical protein